MNNSFNEDFWNGFGAGIASILFIEVLAFIFFMLGYRIK